MSRNRRRTQSAAAESSSGGSREPEADNEPRILIPLPGIGTLSLDPETYRAALVEGERHGRQASGGDEPLLDAVALAALLKIPVTWIEDAARQSRIPSLQFGRWRRFRRSE